MGNFLEDIGGGIGDFIGNVFGSDASDAAIRAQREATDRATQLQREMWEQQREDLAPFREMGLDAAERMSAGSLYDPSMLERDPGYKFRMDEGLKALNAAASAGGRMGSSRTAKDLMRFGQGLASQEYDRAYNREFNRLGSLMNVGTGANLTGVQASGQHGANVSNLYTNLGNAQAANAISGANADKQLFGQGIMAAAMFSDKRLKEGVQRIPNSDLKEMKKHLKAVYFKYKDGSENWAGILAQDLKKSKVGRMLLMKDERGMLMVDLRKVLSMYLATMAEGDAHAN